MAKRYNVGIDVDGVIANFTQAARETMKSLFGGRPDDTLVQTTWAFESLGITKEEENVFWRFVDNTPNWWLGHRAMPHTLALRELTTNHRCIFITNRKDGTGMPIEVQTASWLRTHFGIDDPNVVISDNKGPVAEGLNLDYFIDDRDRNVYSVVEYSPDTRTYLCSATYNQNIYPPEINIVPNFDAFARTIIRRSHGHGN